jgi:hypothetical protein
VVVVLVGVSPLVVLSDLRNQLLAEGPPGLTAARIRAMMIPTKNNGTQATFHHTGPTGLTQISAAHIPSRIMIKKVQKLPQGPRMLNKRKKALPINIAMIRITINSKKVILKIFKFQKGKHSCRLPLQYVGDRFLLKNG